jgi:hypothetical protein
MDTVDASKAFAGGIGGSIVVVSKLEKSASGNTLPMYLPY